MATGVPSEAERFQMDLEFVQYLAQQRYFQQPAFLRYLSYLTYWKQPKYAKYIMYPNALYFLDLIQDAHVQQLLAHQETALRLHEQQYYHWFTNRLPPKQVAESLTEDSTAASSPIKREP